MTKGQFIKDILPLSDKIYRLAYRFLNDPDMAKDMVQGIFLKLWDKRKMLETYTNKEAFVIKMTKNACLDNIKLAKNNVDVFAYHKAVEPKYDHSESVQIVKKIIRTLPNQQKQIIELRDIEGFSFEEISEMMNLSVNNIRVSLSIARKKVRDELNKIYSYGLR